MADRFADRITRIEKKLIGIEEKLDREKPRISKSWAYNKDITQELHIDFRNKLDKKILPQFIRISVNREGATLQYRERDGDRQEYPEDLDVAAPLVIDNESWEEIWIKPAETTRVRIFASTYRVGGG